MGDYNTITKDDLLELVQNIDDNDDFIKYIYVLISELRKDQA